MNNTILTEEENRLKSIADRVTPFIPMINGPDFYMRKHINDESGSWSYYELRYIFGEDKFKSYIGRLVVD